MSVDVELDGLRQHDLPPRWDGLAVVWDAWEPMAGAAVFICPPPSLSDTCCRACGSLAPQPRARGRVAQLHEVTHADIAAEDDRRARLPAREQHQVRRRAWYRLVASRCPDCRLDVVTDLEGDVWTLDATDYGDAGSSPPPVPAGRGIGGGDQADDPGTTPVAERRRSDPTPETSLPVREPPRGRPPTAAQRAAIQAAIHPASERDDIR